jgi:UDP-glucose 4-epimerase
MLLRQRHDLQRDYLHVVDLAKGHIAAINKLIADEKKQQSVRLPIGGAGQSPVPCLAHVIPPLPLPFGTS